MLGKMYRPLEISRYNRGYKLKHKYLSNKIPKKSGGVKEFCQIVSMKAIEVGSLHFKEVIKIDMKDLTIPLLLVSDTYELTSKKEAGEKKEPYHESFNEKRPGFMERKLERPGIIIEMEDETDNPFAPLKKAEFDPERETRDSDGEMRRGVWVIKPVLSSKGEELLFEMPIYPTPSNAGADWLTVQLKPVVYKGTEYLEMKTDSLTKVEITSNTEIILKD